MLIVPANKLAIRSVAIGYDGSAAAAHALSAVRNFLSDLLTAVHAIYVREGEGDEGVLDDVIEHMEGCNVQTHVVDGEVVHEALADAAHATGADVLALGFRGRRRMRDFLFGSATEYIVLNTELIVLVAH
jgi:nucleotide-binding universal stress UspA family protein